MYKKIENYIKSEKSNEYLLMGDWNVVVGEEESGIVIGKYGLDQEIDTETNWIIFLRENDTGIALNNCQASQEQK